MHSFLVFELKKRLVIYNFGSPGTDFVFVQIILLNLIESGGMLNTVSGHFRV